MKIALTGVALCMALAVPRVALADHHDSKLGIGVASTFFVDGLDFRLTLTEEIGFEAVLGFSSVSTDDPVGGSTTNTAFQLGARGLYGLWDFGSRARVLGFGGLSIATASGADTLIGMEGGLKVEVFLVPYSSISADLGVGIGINQGGDTGGSGTVIAIGVGNLVGGAAWTFWW